MKIIIGGALGRMGRELALAAEGAGVEVACGVDVAYAGQAAAFPIVTGYERIPADADVLIDFSRPDALPELLQAALTRRMPVVLCATGYTDVELSSIREAAQTLPVLRSANMSLGVNVLSELVSMAARTLEGFDVEIVEKHHRMKADGPSGTALMLADALAESLPHESEYVYERHSVRQKRRREEIGISSMRGGTIVGEHEVMFAGADEVFTLKHSALSRDVFASGAIAAARYIATVKEPGLYDMDDLLGDM